MVAMMQKLRGRGGRVSAVAVCGALALAACGSSSHNSASTTTTTGATSPTTGGTGTTTAGTAPASGQSYSVMVITVITDAQSYKDPEVVPAVKAAFQGTGVKVLTCDDTFTVAQDQVCEHRAVADHVAAVISGSSTLAADESILTH